MVERAGPTATHDALGAPPVDRVGEDLAMARMQAALFGASKQATLERYALLDKLGEGAHGSVYSAWDPRLDRKVALKVLHGDASEAHEDEARALAKLSHPNVVAVHDVGESEGALFLAMEFVDGTPLSLLNTETLGWRRIVATYRQAAAGLAAAHEAGIVHRDFKPDNALLGRDGRVRVLDFGLARAGLEAATGTAAAVETRAGGTPRYMAPEQHRGQAVDARTDQYCFCVALWEALFGQPPFSGETVEALADAKASAPSDPARSDVPRKVTRILQRGLAPDPEHRHASMTALDAALGTAVQRRTRAAAALGLAGVALAVGLGLGQTDRPCQGADAPPERWNAATRDALTRAFADTGLPHAPITGRSAQEVLAQWASSWSQAHRDACLSHERGVQSAEALDLRTQCLDEQHDHFDTLLDVLLDADRSSVNRAIEAASQLPSPAACSDVESLRAAHRVPPEALESVEEARTTLVRARAELQAAHYGTAAELAKPTVEACDAATLQHAPTCVEALLVAADAASRMAQHDEALRLLRAAAVEAQRARLPVAFAEAASLLTWERGDVDAATDDALTWAALGHASLDGEDSTATLLALLNNEGAALMTAGRLDEATAIHQRRIELLEPGSPLRVHSLVNLANIENRRQRFEEAEVAYAEALEAGIAAYGATHPYVLTARQARAGMRVQHGRAKDAREDLLQVLDAQRRVLGPEHPALAATLTNLSLAQYRLKDFEGALHSANEAVRLVRTAHGDDSPREIEPRLAEADALVALGRTSEAVEASRTALRIARNTFGDIDRSTAYATRSLALSFQASGETEASRREFEAARTLFEALDMPLEVRATERMQATPPNE